MNKGRPDDIGVLEGIVAAEVLIDAVETSALLQQLGVAHALIGGLAVGLYGHPRATKDVDFLVSEAAFDRTEPILVYRAELGPHVRMGVVDLLAVPRTRPCLARLLNVPAEGRLPVIELPALVLLKLDAGRAQDLADVNALLDAGADYDAIGQFLAEQAPDLVDRFTELLDSREPKRR
jgi:hypothetical protein